MPEPCFMAMTRGELIRSGLGGACVLWIAGCAPSAPGDDREMVRAIAGVMLAGAAGSRALTRAELDRAVDGVFVAISGLPPAVRGEVAQLFSLLRIPLGRVLAAGVTPPWSLAAPADVAAFLTRWRTSGVLLFRSGYQALHQLVMAGWYGGDDSWKATGYDGPPRLR